MKYEMLLDNTEIPVLGFGTWDIGGERTPDYSRDDELVTIIQRVIEMGYTHIDTAEMYAGGHTEELIGRTIQGMDRSSLFITSKVWSTNLRYDDVLQSLDGSLSRLGIDSLDLYLIHWPNSSIPLADTFKALNEAVADGRVKRLGVSNFDRALLQEAIDLAHTPIFANQVRYNLLSRGSLGNGTLEFCQQQGILVTAYSPLKDGVLRHPDVVEIAQSHGVTPAQVAIAWLLHQPKVITIPKSITESHLQDNLNAVSLELSDEDMARLDGLI